MAVFTSKADHDVPFLTWASQVSLADDEAGRKERQTFARRFFHWQQINTDSDAFRLYCDIVRRLLRQLYESGKVDPNTASDYKELQELTKPEDIEYDIAPDPDGKVPVTALLGQTVWPNGVPSWVIYFAAQARDLLVGFNDKSLRLAQCPECGSIFARSRVDQQLCSTRCRTRRNARESWQRNHAGKKISI